MQVRGKDAAVSTVESLGIEDLMPSDPSSSESADNEGFTAKMKNGIQARLQESLTQKGWPVTVIGIFSDGFTFSNKSEDKIAEIVGVRMERVKLDLREKNARRAKDVFRTEAEADAIYINGLRAAGLPEKDVAYALCLKMNRDADRVNEPLGAGCGGNPAGVAVAVEAGKATAPKATAVPTPAPSPVS